VQSASGNQTTVTVTQSQQQALLQWQTFNVGKNTTLAFDQSAGGTDVGNWIAFNYVRDPTGNPTQILGAIKTLGAADSSGNAQVGGQVYVMNSNGIIFGGSSQVNAHALVASSLPIDYNLIQQGLLNNPDAQFLFSALPQTSGSKGPTPAFDPTQSAPDGSVPIQTPYAADGSGAVGNYGDVVVQPGAQLTAPSNADHVGGRIALIGPNVTNAGTIETPDGQTILAAGLQVGFATHRSDDPTLRGLDVYVGEVADASLPNQPASGTATNAGLNATNLGVTLTGVSDATSNPNNLNILGLIKAPHGDVYITGKNVNQSGVIDSTTSVAYNGRVDLVAGYNAVSNANYDPNSGSNDPTSSLPFFYESNVGYSLTGTAVPNSGPVVLGSDSLIQILPETGSTDRVVGDLTLPSQVNIQGQSVHFEPNAYLLAPGAATPLAKAYGADGSALEAGVTIQAGIWYNPGTLGYRFVQSDDGQQIYLDSGVSVDVSGLTDVEASVAENIISVELRGSELANSPVQREGVLRGQTIQVDVRLHGPWDPSLNDGAGGYTWVGTPLADTSGWVGLTTHSVGELSINGGSVAFKSGGALVLKSGATIDVSGGFINFQGGTTQTTQVMGVDGHIYSIANASPNIQYTGIYTGNAASTDPKWGVTSSSSNPLAQSTGTYENGYIQGGSGGSLSITAPVVALDGTLLGNTVAGPTQRTLSPLYNAANPPDPANPIAAGVPGWLVETASMPIPSQLSITVGRQYSSTVAGVPDYREYSPTPANIVFCSDSALPPVGGYQASGDYLFGTQRNYELDLSPSLVSNDSGAGFGIIRIDNSDDNLGTSQGYGNISVAKGTVLAMPAGGSLSLSAGNFNIEDSGISGDSTGISAPGGAIALRAYDISPSSANYVSLLRSAGGVPQNDIPNFDAARGTISIGVGATISTAGLLVDDRPSSSTSTDVPLVTKGGSLSLNANNILLESTSVLDVSGGGAFGGTGKLTYDNAGAISINAGKALGSGFGTVFGGDLEMTGAILRGYAGIGKQGGSLTLQAPTISIQTLASGDIVATDSTTGDLSLGPDFFNGGGFSSFALTGLGIATEGGAQAAGAASAFTVAANTILDPQVYNWQSTPGAAVYLAPEGVRLPAQLTFKTAGVQQDANNVLLDNDASLTLEAGSAVETGAEGSVTLSGGSRGTIEVLGGITANGGEINITQPDDGFYLPTVHLGPACVLDAAGVATYTFDATGYHKTNVLAGGTILVDGNIVAEKGALLDVSGASDQVFVPAGNLSLASAPRAAVNLVPVAEDSNGGSITLRGEEMFFCAASLLGGAGARGNGAISAAQGGDLVISSGRAGFLSPDGSGLPGPADPVLAVASSTPAFVFNGLGKAVTDASGTEFGNAKGLGLIWAGADSFSDAGFGALTFSAGQGAVQIQGNVTISAARQITIADGGVLSLVSGPAAAGISKPSLSHIAPYVMLGQPFLGPLQSDQSTTPFSQDIVPTHGLGVLSIQANSLIDVGNLVLQGVNTAILDTGSTGTSSGAIRGDGTLDVAGAITLKAGQIYPTTATIFNVIAFDFTSNGSPVAGSVTIESTGDSNLPPLPLSAGGTLNLYASVINQGGVLRAPLGMINLGATGGVDAISGQNLPSTATLTLESGSITSVSALDPNTGAALRIPYGINVNGDVWIDPTGTDITNVGPVAKAVTLTASNISLQAKTASAGAADIDLTGGGDLYAYQFVSGTGGTNDVLLGNTAESFAILPGYSSVYAPVGTYNTTTVNALGSLGSDPGYVVGNSNLKYKIGDLIFLEGVAGLPNGEYTLLPARYALLTGAYLVTPFSSSVTAGPSAGAVQADGSTVASGYRFNGFENAGSVQSLYQLFDVAPQSAVLNRAQYDSFSANSFFAGVASQNGAVAPRLPEDAGQLILTAESALNLQGTVDAQAASGARGGLIDISSSADILIGSKPVISAIESDGNSTTLLIDAAQLSSFDSESLLIGGTRSSGVEGTVVDVTSGNVTVDNAGAPLTGSDIVLVANNNLTLKNGAEIGQSDQTQVTAETLNFSGDGALLRVSSDPTAQIIRSGITESTTPALTIGARAKIAGGSAILDSTNTLNIDPKADFTGISALALDSSQISIQLAGAGPLRTQATGQTTSGLILSGDILESLQNSATAVSLLSYSSIDLYGSGMIGSPTFASLSMHAPEIYGDGGNVTFAAKNILLDNSSNLTAPDSIALPPGTSLKGTVEFNATNNLQVGANPFAVEQYAKVDLSGLSSIVVQATGGFTTQGDLTMTTPLLAAAAGTGTPKQAIDETITAGGTLSVVALVGAGQATAGSGNLGASLTLAGQSIDIGSMISLQSGTLTLHATGTNPGNGVNLESSSILEMGGVERRFYDVTKYSDGGSVSLIADNGSVTVGSGATIDVSAQTGGGNAGSLSVSVPNGSFMLTDGSRLQGYGGADGMGGADGSQGGTFTLDVRALPSTAALDAALNFNSATNADGTVLSTGGFSNARSIRVRTGNATVDGLATTHSYTLSTDQGAITVSGTGKIDASGKAATAAGNVVDVPGNLASGEWQIDASENVIDRSGNVIALQGGTGGTIDLAASGSVTLKEGAVLTVAGTYFNAAGKGGAVSLEAGSSTNGVAPSMADTRNPASGAFQNAGTPVVDIQTGSSIDLSVAASTVTLAAGQTYSVLMGTGDVISSNVDGQITDGTGAVSMFSAGILPALYPGSTIMVSGAGQLAFLVNAATGTATGTLLLRAPQTTPIQPTNPLAPSVAPDVQINPINGSIVNPSSIVVEGYKTYAPFDGYVDSVEVAIDTDGQSLASAANTGAIIGRLTTNWGIGASQLNGNLSKLAGVQLHVRPGAEVDGTAIAPNTNTIVYSTPGSTSSLQIPAAASLILPSTTDSSKGPSMNTVLFSSASVLTPVDAGSYTYSVSSIGTNMTGTPLAVLSSTTIKVSSAVAANRLTSSIGGTVRLPNGSLTTFAAGPLPALAANSTLAFSGPGMIASAGSSVINGLSLSVTDSFAGGSSISLPANSSVSLTTNGGSVIFTNSGILTWANRAPSTTNSFAIEVPSDGSFTTGSGNAVIATAGASGTDVTLIKSTPANMSTGGASLILGAGGSMFLPQGTSTTANTSSTANTVQIAPSISTSTGPFMVTIESVQGETLQSVIGSITTQKGGIQTLAKKTLDASGIQLDAGGTLAFSSPSQIVSSVAGIVTLPRQTLSTNGITIPAVGGTITIPAGTNLAAGALISTIGGTITSPDGAVRAFPANNIPAVTSGSVITVAAGAGGTFALVSTTAAPFLVTVTNNLPAATSTAITANSTVKITTGGTVATTSGSANNVTIVNYMLPGKTANVSQGDILQLAGTADTVTVQSTCAFTLSSGGPTNISVDTANPTATLVSFLGGTGNMLAVLPSGNYVTSGTTNITTSSAIGNLVLASNWVLSSFRYGPNVDSNNPGSGEPGILTLRAPGNLVLNANASLSDGFRPTTSTSGLWQATLLPSGTQSWSYELVAGADLAAADVTQVQPLATLGSTSGSLLLGEGSGALPTSSTGNVSRSVIIPQFYQTIRTGTGDIDVRAGCDVQFLSPLATIYTAGTAANPMNGFDVPALDSIFDSIGAFAPYYPAQYSLAGGNVAITAQNDIVRYVQSGTAFMPSSSKELPTNWLYRRGDVGTNGLFTALAGTSVPTSEVQSTTWWIDFSNFFEDVGALGGGNVTLVAGRNVSNIDASVPTNARMPGRDSSGSPVAPAASRLAELGGGDLVVHAGNNIDGGVYYVERGDARLSAGGNITTNPTRAAFSVGDNTNPVTWLPTTFFLGEGSVAVSAVGDLEMGQVANPFWLPQGAGNRAYEATFFSTFAPSDSVTVASLNGAVTLQGQAAGANISSLGSDAWLLDWYVNAMSGDRNAAAASQPWLNLAVNSLGTVQIYQTIAGVMPSAMHVTAFSGDINLVGSLTLAPASSGTLDLLAAGNINGMTINGVDDGLLEWSSAVINLSDADPAQLPSPASPLSFASYTKSYPSDLFSAIDAHFAEAGGTSFSLQEELALHAQVHDQAGNSVPLHFDDPEPVHLYATAGDLSGVTLYSAKSADVIAHEDVTDVALYVQNVRADDTSVVAAGRDLIPYDPASPLRQAAQKPGNELLWQPGETGPAGGMPTAGDIQVSGPGVLEVLAGRNLDLGSGSNATTDGTAVGITSVGSIRNPSLPQNDGADIMAAAGLGSVYTANAIASALTPGLVTTDLRFSDFAAQFLNPATAGARAASYLPDLATILGIDATSPDDQQIWATFETLPEGTSVEREAKDRLLLEVFYDVLRSSGRDRNNPESPNYRTYADGLEAIATLFPSSPLPTEEQTSSGSGSSAIQRPAGGSWSGTLSMQTREIETFEGGDISLLIPGGSLIVGRATDPQKPDQGVLTERGGNISVFSADNIAVGTSRIFTLRGGNEILWSTWGNIAAGSGSKTVHAAPPTRVLVDPQSADVQNDLAGLATGAGIGVLATLTGVAPGDVDLIAPVGTIDAGDAGIRSSGNLNLAARVVLNASNIQVGGASVGTPPPPAAPNLAPITAASNASAAATSTASDVARQETEATQTQITEVPSIITVEVVGYGGGEDESNSDDSRGSI
jgi:filamentous hemagglutinin family protein